LRNRIASVLFLSALAASCSQDKPSPPAATAAAAPLRKAPDFTLRDHQGKTVSLKDFSPGRIVVLVWLNWRSPVCQRHLERENFQWLYDYYTSDDVAWLGINSTPDATPQENAAAVETHNLEFPILDDRRGDVARLYGARTTPHLFVVNAKGEIAYQGAFDDDPTGEKDLDSVNYVEEAIENLLAEEPVERPVSQPYGDAISIRPGAP